MDELKFHYIECGSLEKAQAAKSSIEKNINVDNVCHQFKIKYFKKNNEDVGSFYIEVFCDDEKIIEIKNKLNIFLLGYMWK